MLSTATEPRPNRHALDWRLAILGGYLAYHLAALVPWAGELFSRDGMLPQGTLSPLIHAFPNVLALHDGWLFATLFVASGAMAATLLALGVRHRTMAVWCLFVLACVFGRNPLIRNPSLPYVGLALLAVIATRGQRVPWRVVRVLWILLAVGYAYSGLTKLAAPSWLDGSAFEHVLANPLAHAHAEWLRALPSPLLALATYGALALEILFPLLALSERARPWTWLAMTALHLGLLLLIDFADLTLGMLVIHAFVFDERWLRRTKLAPTGTSAPAAA